MVSQVTPRYCEQERNRRWKRMKRVTGKRVCPSWDPGLYLLTPWQWGSLLSRTVSTPVKWELKGQDTLPEIMLEMKWCSVCKALGIIPEIQKALSKCHLLSAAVVLSKIWEPALPILGKAAFPCFLQRVTFWKGRGRWGGKSCKVTSVHVRCPCECERLK